MRKHMLYLEIIILILLSGCSEKNTSQDKQTHRPNILSQKELQEGWRLLFDGETTRGWRGANMDHFPEYGWTIENGCLIVNKGGRKAGKRGGDIVTLKKYANFDLRFEFKLTPNANSGIKYFVVEYPNNGEGTAIGCEYQIIDDNHPAIKNDPDKKRYLASLYALFEPHNRPLRPIGEWNEGRIVVKGKHVEHWLNGVKVLEYERGSKEFEEARLKSKFKKYPDFGIVKEGYILIQDHGDEVHFRNIKIKEL